MLDQYKNKYIVKWMPEGVKREDQTQYIPCGKRPGLDHIYAISDTKLGLWLTGGKKIRRIMAGIKGLELLQDGEGEAVIGFTPDLLPKVAQFAKARRRRRMNPEQRAMAVERMKRINNAKRF